MNWAGRVSPWGTLRSARSQSSAAFFLLSFSVLANPLVHRRPALIHTRLVLLGNESERSVLEGNQRSAIDFAQPVLHVRHERERRKQRPNKLQQRGPHNRLHVGPEMPIAIAHVAIPASAGPRFDLYIQRFAVWRLVARPKLFEQRGKGDIQRRLDVDFLVDRKSQVFKSLFGGNHRHHFSLRFVCVDFKSEPWRTIASARSFTRFNWCCQ